MEVDTLLDKLRNFSIDGHAFLNTQSEIDLVNMIALCNNYYFNRGISLVNDNLYDSLTAYSIKKYPKKKKNTNVGAPVSNSKVKVQLPFKMASMNKIKPDTNALSRWMEKYKGPYIITSKLDGISALYHGKEHKLYTRGDGVEGQDISHMLPYLGMNDLNTECSFRGELIINKTLFQAKYSKVYANARNMVSGLVNKKVNAKNADLQEMLCDVHFVIYELLEPNVAPCVQHDIISKFSKLRHVYNMEIDDLSNELLTTVLIKIREQYEYEVDGIVVTNDEYYERDEVLKNPDHSFAFKTALTNQFAEAIVVDVIWSPSKDGYMKPRVQIEPVHLCGVNIEYLTGFNAKYIYENKIGIGAMIEVVRSGDVIPYINSVLRSSESPKMPPNMENYKWTDSNVDLMLKEEHKCDNLDVMEKQIAGFFKKIKVDGLSNGNVRKIINYDNTVTVESISKMTIDDFIKIPGFQQKMATKISESIAQRLRDERLENIMSASNIFGRGFSEKRLGDIMEAHPDILTSGESDKDKIDKVKNVNGISIKTATQFVAHIQDFKDFLENMHLTSKLQCDDEERTQDKQTQKEQKEQKETKHLANKTFVMTGFRDEELQNYITSNGGKIGSAITKNSVALLVKETGYKENTKTAQAQKKGIPILTRAEFYEQFK